MARCRAAARRAGRLRRQRRAHVAPANGAYSAACTGLVASAKLAGTTLATSYVAPDSKRPGGAATGAFLPGHCVVTGSINPRVGVDGKNYAIGFQLSLPDNWNGRFLFVGAAATMAFCAIPR